MTLDPVLAWLPRIGLALLFASAAWHKTVDRAHFAASVERYRLLPAWAVRPAAAALNFVEGGVALGLLMNATVRPAAATAFSLLALYTTAILINLGRGRRDLDCGCFGPSMRAPIHGGIVARNVALMAAAIASGLPVADRPLAWVDLVTLGCALVATSLLWLTAQQLTTNALRRRGDVR